MSKVWMYSVAGLKAGIVALLMTVGVVALAKEPSGQLIDSPYVAMEARAIELIVNAGGDVVGIKGKGCPGCPSGTILPARGLVVEAAGGRRLDGKEMTSLNGMPGVIHIYEPTGMAHRVSFPGVLYPGGDEQ
ncbi:hypothetical protein QQF73_17870 [Marinobacter sp. M216]|uniref:Uncharacterized protein n=1 Tax=Marinobacter albus TaxID=3030833 RepID=A0ABT7HHV5_9GAMM|nr:MULTISPECIES: hypothetical protein [unclassified Marinobacter]MBW7473100.1 hypothetical protein [Marinobacter sp. F4218]MDK9559507.1 hypothetical protein [Marinobacter sp. M216]